MYKYKLVQLKDGIDPEKPKKWYAISVSKQAQDGRKAMRAAAENTTISDVEMEAAFELMMRYAAQQLRQGQKVQLGRFGSLRVTFRSEGVDEAEQFNANAMIRQPRVVFRPSAEFRELVLKGLTFRLDSILDDGVAYGSFADYRRAKRRKEG